MFRQWLFLAMVALPVFVTGGGLAVAAEPERFYKIFCPAVWPGPEGPLALTGDNAWAEWKYETTSDGWNLDLTNTKADSIQLDCAYGGSYRDSWRRITVKVPGHVRKCVSRNMAGTWRRQGPLVCETRPDYGGELGSVSWRIATPVSTALRLFGFGLDMSSQEIRESAVLEGYDVEDVADHLILSRQGRRFDITIFSGTNRPREIALISDDYDEESKAAFTFGLGFQEWPLRETPPNFLITKRVWYSPDRRTVLEYWPPTHEGERPSVHLIDKR